MCKFCWAVVTAISLISIADAIEPPLDGRTVIAVTPAEREQILEEMRGLLEAVHTIILANNADDPGAVDIAARKVGKASLSPKAPEFTGKLPIEFRQLGMDTHSRFDLLALSAEQSQSTEQTLQQLGAITANCVACHRAYRLTTVDSK